MALVDNVQNDVFLSYARDDNVLNDDVVWHFRDHLKRKLEAEIRRRFKDRDVVDAMIFMDEDGLPANGELSEELEKAVTDSLFLVIFIGQSYPDSEWCGRELATFSRQFAGNRQKALERTFVVVLEREAARRSWGEYLEEPARPIFESFYDEQTGEMIPAILEGKGGLAVLSPRFSKRLRKIAETMAGRVLALEGQA